MQRHLLTFQKDSKKHHIASLNFRVHALLKGAVVSATLFRRYKTKTIKLHVAVIISPTKTEVFKTE